jgi:hypothetical protein
MVFDKLHRELKLNSCREIFQNSEDVSSSDEETGSAKGRMPRIQDILAAEYNPLSS